MPASIRRSFLRLATLTAIAFAAQPSGPAWSQDAYCEDLRARLAAASNQGGDSRARLYRQLSDARAEARYQGCGGGIFGGMFGRRPSPACGQLNAEIRQLERQLRDLDYRDRWSWGNRRRGEDAVMLRQMMRDAGCSESARTRAANWGPYRSLCVRTCDGYFFPVSSSAKRSDLQTHAAACQAMCPGQEVSLYYLSVDQTEDPADAVSLAGAKYSQLPTAFRFRESYNPSCSCTPAGGWASVADAYRQLAARANGDHQRQGSPALVPAPVPKPARSEDGETLANRAGDFIPQPTDPIATAEAVASPAAVRFIGPAFYYAR